MKFLEKIERISDVIFGIGLLILLLIKVLSELHIVKESESFIFPLVYLIVLGMYFVLLPKVQSILSSVKEISSFHKSYMKFILGKTSLIKPAEHPDIWRDYVNVYYALNPPWNLEFNISTNVGKLEDLLNIHLARYKNDELKKVIYIFFKDTRFKEAKNNCKKFFEKLLTLTKSEDERKKILEKALFVEVSSKAPNFTAFVGEKAFNLDAISSEEKKEKEYVPYSVIYINDYPFLNQNGYPKWAFVSTDKKVFLLLKDYIEDLLNNEKNRKFSLREFLAS